VPGFVDVHSHMIPSGDDGVRTVTEGLTLLRETARRGTVVQYGTPHANLAHPLSAARRARTEAAHAEMAEELSAFGLELRLGWELAPETWLLDTDPSELRLGGLRAALLEFPLPHTGARDLDLLTACVEHLEAADIVPILAHPERSRPVQDALHVASAFRERGCLLQLNASSLLGQDDERSRVAGAALLADGLYDLVASDAHRASRPPYLDGAYRAVTRVVGIEAADRLLGGSALAPLADADVPSSPAR
jgi:protein-tyrosine phosphatase